MYLTGQYNSDDRGGRTVVSHEVVFDGSRKMETTVYQYEDMRLTRVVGFVVRGKLDEMFVPGSPQLSHSPLFGNKFDPEMHCDSPERLSDSHPVITAIDKGNTAGLEKAWVNAIDANGMSMLERAIGTGHVSVVSWLVTNGADISVRSSKANEPMPHIAVKRNNFEMINALMTAPDGQNILRQTNEEGFTPFHLAISLKNLVTAKYLYQKGVANVRQANCCGLTPLHTAAKIGFEDGVDFLLRKDPWVANFGDVQNRTPLHLAVKENHSKVVDLLLAKEPFLDQPDNNGNTALHLAARKKRVALCSLFLRRGASPLIRNMEGNIPQLSFLHIEHEKVDLLGRDLIQWISVPLDQSGCAVWLAVLVKV